MNKVTVQSSAAIDAPLRDAYERIGTDESVSEFGFAGLRKASVEIAAPHVSAWLPGVHTGDYMRLLSRWEQSGKRFRFLFAERYHAPSAEAHRLFTKKDLGLPLHFLVKVQAHPATLCEPEMWREPAEWLSEPILNRISLMVWMMGPVADARIVESQRKDARALIVMLRHREPQRLSILEMALSPDITRGGEPAVIDRFECTGSDGFLRVNGIWGACPEAPRLELHRGAFEMVQRDLPRTVPEMAECAARRSDSGSFAVRESYRLAYETLSACALVAAIPA